MSGLELLGSAVLKSSGLACRNGARGSCSTPTSGDGPPDRDGNRNPAGFARDSESHGHCSTVLRRMTESLLTPSKITAWLDCDHYLTLRRAVDAGTLTAGHPAFGSLAQVLVDKGVIHEADCLAEYRRKDRTIYEVPGQRASESFAGWLDRIGNPFDSDVDVIYQMPFSHDGVRGIADFLVRVDDPEPGCCRYEPVDAKLARSEGKPGHVLQLCFYAEALEVITGAPPKSLHLWLGSGRMESLVSDEFRPYWNRMRRQLAALVDPTSGGQDTAPEPCSHCEFCEIPRRLHRPVEGDGLAHLRRRYPQDRSGHT